MMCNGRGRRLTGYEIMVDLLTDTIESGIQRLAPLLKPVSLRRHCREGLWEHVSAVTVTDRRVRSRRVSIPQHSEEPGKRRQAT